MAQDAELKLKVSLDLAFFRQQISTIGTQLAGQGIDLVAKIDEDDVVKQYNSLAKTLESKTLKIKVESATLDTLVTKAANLKKSLEEFGGQKISLGVEIADNIDDLRKSIKSKLPAIKIGTSLEEPVNVDDFIRDVAKKVKDQTERSYVAGGIPIATKLALPGITEPLSALQKNLNRQDPLRAKVGTTPSIKRADVTAFQNAVNEKFQNVVVKVKAELEAASVAPQGATAAPSRTFLQELKGLDKGTLQDVYRAAAKDALLAFDEGIINNKAKMAQALNKAAEDASAGFVAALENKKSALFKAAGEYAGALLGGLKTTLKIQSPSREMWDIGDDAGKGFELGLLKAMKLAEKSATNQMRRMLDRLARMALMMGGMSAAEINKQVGQSRALPGVNFPATVPPRLGVPIGPSETGRALPAGRAAAGLIGAAQAPAGLLPSATRQSGLTLGLEALIQSLVSQTQKRGPEGPGAIVSMETGFIPAMRERFAKAAQNYLFGVETQVLDLFDAALRQVESAVDLHIAKIQGQISQRLRSTLSVVDLGVQGRPMLPGAAAGQPPLMLPSAGGTTPLRQMRFNAVTTGGVIPPSPLMLPPAGGTTPPSQMRFNAVSGGRRGGGGAVPSAGFPSEGILGGRQGEATFIGAGSQMERFKTALDVAGESMRNFRASQIPLVGGLKEIASEFGFALKQVLLFGTAYKGLAFVQSLPGQILNAAKSQQQYNNALQTATQDTGTFAKELLYVDNVQRAFGLNLETTRSGFTKLYASMAPTGFDSGSIEKLFTGISAATAALQLTPDKAERVIYAFGQMASKGQIMSEELKGQLGDVLPGALALFADAAGMSIKEFSKAMEDGEFVGSKFRDTFAKVSDELMTRFGTGAQAAGRSLQGLLNTVQGDFTRTLESFAPLANAAAQAVLLPLSASLSQLSKAASLAFGEQERVKKQLEDAKASDANAQSIAALEAKLAQLNDAARDPAIANQAKDIENFVAEVTKAARAVSDFASGIGSILGPIFVGLGTNLTGVVNTLGVLALSFAATRAAAMLAMGTLATMNAVVQAGGSISAIAAARATVLAGVLRLVGVSATGAQVATIGFGTAVKGLLASTGVGLLVVALGSVATAFLNVGNKATEAAERTKAAMAKMQDAIRSGNVEIAKSDLYQTQRQRNSLEDSVKLLDRLAQKGRRAGSRGGQIYAQTTLAERMLFEDAGLDLQGRTEIDVNQVRRQIGPRRNELINLEQRQKVGVGLAEQQRQKIGINEPKPVTTVETESPDDGKRERQLRDFNSEAIDQLRTNQRIAQERLQQQQQLEIIDETEYVIASAANKRKYELLIIEEALAQKKAGIGEYQIGVREKQLAVFEKLAANERTLVEEEEKTAIKGAKLKLERPFKDAIRDENIEITKQGILLENLNNGYEGLTAEQEANLIVEEKTKDLRARQIKLVQTEIDKLRQVTLERIRGARALQIEQTVKGLRDQLSLLRAVSEEEQSRLRIAQENQGATQEQLSRIYNLKTVRDNLAATREIIDSFVTDTSSDYKGFLKEIISGEDAVDSLKKFQEALKDRTLTIFLDFAMAPVEKFFKEVAGGNLLKALFPESAEEKTAAAQANNTTALGTVKTAIELATNAINNLTTTIGGGIGVPSSVNTASFGVSNVGNDLASQLMNERGYEDVAGLLPLPLEKMRQQAARPLRMIWQQIQGAMEGVYGMAEKEIKKTFKPNPAIHQKVLQGIQRVESFRTGPNAWDPGEAQWKERENRWREDKRSKPSSMPLQSFMTTATQMRDSLSEVVRKAGGLAVSSGTRLGSQLDFSDYLSEQQKKILTTGVKEVLNSAMNASFQELRGSAQSNRDPSRMPSFEKATSQMQNLLPSFRTVIEEALSQEAAKGQRYAMDAMKKFGMQAPVDPSFYRSLEYLDPSRGQERLRELGPLNEPPRINPGIENQFEGASLPFNMQKMSTSYGQVATIGGLNGLVDGGNLLEMAGVNLESFASNVETFKAGTENLNSSMEGVVNSTYATAQQMSPEGDAGNQFMKALGATVQGIGIAAGSIMGIMAGINQVKEGGTSNVLGGIGMIASAAGSLLGGISSLGGMFKGGGGANMGGSNYFDPLSGKGVAGPNFGLAKGGIMHGGFTPFRAFANGGIVTGPTMGLVGEGRYSEAVVPLPDGKSIPVTMNGGQSSRDLLSNGAAKGGSSPILSMSFQSTTINGVEYVDRAQLEAAMAETRRLAARDGASQGSQLALNKLKNSPTTRRQLGF